MRSNLNLILAIAAFGLSLSACGGETANDMGKFTGTWHATSGTQTVTCQGWTPPTLPVVDNVTWSRGVSSDLILLVPDSSCVIQADAAGSTATGGSAPCFFLFTDTGETLPGTVTSYTFVVAPDGKTAQENATVAYLVTQGGSNTTCTGTETASYQKIRS
jgi:hypothetical protein